MIIRALRACRATLTPRMGVLSVVVVLGASVMATAAILPPTTARPAPSVAPSAAAGAAPVVARAPRTSAPRASRSGRTALAARPATVLRTVPVGRTFSGSASWYGAELHGNRTANGERFDMHELTAASRTLPFGTRLNVCLAHSPGRCVIVRINDRGPYVGNRVLDLSAAARQSLGFGGVARVTATPVERRRIAATSTPDRTSERQSTTSFRRLPPAVRAAGEPPPEYLAAPVRGTRSSGDISSGHVPMPAAGSATGSVTWTVAGIALLLLLGSCWGPALRLRLPPSKEFPWSSRSSVRRLA